MRRAVYSCTTVFETPTQTKATAYLQETTGEIWGRAMRGGGAFPCVKAYWGPLPIGARGVEFACRTPPTHPNPSMALWLHNYHQDIMLVTVNQEDFAVIRVRVTQNTQVP